MESDAFYSEIYHAKTENVRVRPKSSMKFRVCEECKAWRGHEVTCSKVTVEAIAELLRQSRDSQEAMRAKAARWLEHLQRTTGKLAMLKHENNKLRKANEKLRASRSP